MSGDRFGRRRNCCAAGHRTDGVRLHDMRRVLELAEHFKVPCLICVNKFDLNLDQTAAIEAVVKERNIPVVGKIPFDPNFTKAMVQGETIFEYDPDSDLSMTVKQLWETVGHYLYIVT